MRELREIAWFLHRLPWLLFSRVAKWENTATGEVRKVKESWGVAWALTRPYGLTHRLLVEMPCGCSRYPWKKRPTLFCHPCGDEGHHLV